MTGTRWPTAVIAFVALAVVLASCSSSTTTTATSDTSATAAASGTVIASTTTTDGAARGVADGSVEAMTETFVDESRATDAGAETESRADRTLETQIFVPGGDGPFPLIVFSHGLNGHPDAFSRLLTAWAEQGYVVAAPVFPLTSLGVAAASSNWADVTNQPDDVTFVIDEVLALSASDDHALAGLVDAEHIGAAGLSLGGITTYTVALNDCCEDERIDAAVILAARVGLDAETGTFTARPDTPVLVMHGEDDPVFALDLAAEAYALVEPPKYFVTLLGGTHAEPFNDSATPYGGIVDTVTLDFWAAYLLDDPTATDRLVSDAVVDGISLLEYDI